jgi:hypothetical protein
MFTSSAWVQVMQGGPLHLAGSLYQLGGPQCRALPTKTFVGGLSATHD